MKSLVTDEQCDKTPLHTNQFLELAQFVFINLPLGIFRSIPEPDGTFVLVNPAIVKMFNYPDTNVILDIPVKETYLNPEDRTAFLEKLFLEGKVNGMVFQFCRFDGTTFWGAITGKLVYDASGKPRFVDGAIQNITEVREKELRLIEERTFSDSVIEALPGMFWLNDEDGKCVRWNKNVETVYGYSSEELPGLHALRDVTSPETLPELMKATENALAGGSGYCEYDGQTKHGKTISFAGDARPITINGKKYLACVEIDITKRKAAEKKLRHALEEIRQLKEKTDAENVYLLDEINSDRRSDFIVGRSARLNQTLYLAQKVAATPTTVLVQGETGTGKGLLASFIHNNSPRSKRPLIKLNCANLPSTLIESILFGHEKGAFTGANTSKIGRFELADGSTILLDEIAELPLELQAKLLRVIEEGEFERLGGTKTITVDVRIVAATNRNLEEEVRNGNFRQDLLFRLNVYPITTPPLRERRSDIPLLVQFFVNKFNKSLGKSIREIPNNVLQQLESYSWPGNIRELQNVIERSIINSNGESLALDDCSIPTIRQPARTLTQGKTLQAVETQHILSILEETNWVIEGETGAAKTLGLNPSTLRGRMRKLGIRRPGIIIRF